MSRYAEAAAAVTTPESPRAGPTMCCAAGCPMPGSITDATTGAGEWWCALHHGAPYAQHAGITTRIRNRQALLVLAARLSNADAALRVPAGVVDWLRRHNRVDFADAAVRCTARRLGAKMRLVLHDECREPQQTMQTREKPQGRESWMNAGKLLEGLV